MPRTAYATARQGTTTVTVEYEVPDSAVNENVWDTLEMAVQALKDLTGESNDYLELSAEIV